MDQGFQLIRFPLGTALGGTLHPAPGAIADLRRVPDILADPATQVTEHGRSESGLRTPRFTHADGNTTVAEKIPTSGGSSASRRCIG